MTRERFGNHALVESDPSNPLFRPARGILRSEPGDASGTMEDFDAGVAAAPDDAFR